MPKFGDLEAVIMDEIWRFNGQARVRDVVTAIQRERDIAFTTVQTVMNILHGKGWLARVKTGRAYRYWAAKPREEYTAKLLSEALDTTADRGAAFSRLVDTLDPDEIGELRQALDQAKGRQIASATHKATIRADAARGATTRADAARRATTRADAALEAATKPEATS